MADEPPSDAGATTDLSAARLVCKQNQDILFRQHSQFDSLDLKASFIVAVAAVLLGGLLTAIVTKPPSNAHVFDLAASSAALLFVTIVFGLVVWWPRNVGTYNPRGLHERHFADIERDALLAISSHAVDTWERNARVESIKVFGIRAASISFSAAVILGATAVFATLS